MKCHKCHLLKNPPPPTKTPTHISSVVIYVVHIPLSYYAPLLNDSLMNVIMFQLRRRCCK